MIFLTLQHPERQAVFLSKVHSTSTVKQVLDPLDSIINGSITRDTVLLPFTLRGFFCTKVIFLTMKTLSGSQCSYTQTTKLSSQNKVFDPPASKTHLSLTGDVVLLQST
jgi:hypothetical protein